MFFNNLLNALKSASQTLPSFPIYGLILFFGLSFWLLIIWYESRKDGFDTERFFDLAFAVLGLCSLSAYLWSQVLEKLGLYYPNFFFTHMDYDLLVITTVLFLTLIPVMVLSKKWKWSPYRVMDIFALSYAVILPFLSAIRYIQHRDLMYLAASFITVIFYTLVLRQRGYKYFSGAIYSFFILYLTAFGFAFYRKPGYLFFYPILVTMGLLNLYFRRKQDMAGKNLPLDFINSIKNRLIKKDKALSEEQALLRSEDPYLDKGRTEDNSEYMDEAILEDQNKELIDTKLSLIRSIRVQVRRALAAIKVGKYGICENCHQPIDKARLAVYPEATLCLNCSQDKEQLEENK